MKSIVVYSDGELALPDSLIGNKDTGFAITILNALIIELMPEKCSPDIDRTRLHAYYIFMEKPHLALTFLEEGDAKTWQRIIGPFEMQNAGENYVPKYQEGWCAAKSALKANGVIVESIQNDVFKPGPNLKSNPFGAPDWAIGRAKFLSSALRNVDF